MPERWYQDPMLLLSMKHKATGCEKRKYISGNFIESRNTFNQQL